MADLNGKRVAFLATDMVEQVELTEPWKAVEEAGGKPELVSLEEGEIQGFNHYDKADTFEVDRTVEDVERRRLRRARPPRRRRQPRHAADGRERGRASCATSSSRASRSPSICHGPWMLVEADVVARPHAHVVAEHRDRHQERRRRTGSTRRSSSTATSSRAASRTTCRRSARSSSSSSRERPSAGRCSGVEAALLDVDGTLIDSNYQHALAWYRAFRQHGLILPVWRIHRARRHGRRPARPRARRRGDRPGAGRRDPRHADALYEELIDEVEPLRGRARPDRRPEERGLQVVLASSAPRTSSTTTSTCSTRATLADAWTTKDDVEADEAGARPGPGRARQGGTERRRHGRRHALGHRGRGESGRRTVAVMTGGWSRAGAARRGRRRRLRVGGRAARDAGRDAAYPALSGLIGCKSQYLTAVA